MSVGLHAAAAKVPMQPMDDELGSQEPKEKKGLERGWEEGERLAWKGIWFKVATVTEGALVLVPDSMTSKRAKALRL